MSLTIRWSRGPSVCCKPSRGPLSTRETAEYRRRLMGEVERKIQVLGTSMPSPEEQYQGTYRILVDPYKVYYSLNAAHTGVYIEAIKHMRMQ